MKYVLSQENVSFCSKKIKLSFKNVNEEENKWEAPLLLADQVSNHQVSNHDDLNIFTCER